MRQTLRFFAIVFVILFIPAAVHAGSIFVANHSFESPYIAPVYPYAGPIVDNWIELDVDTDNSANTGVFVNVTGIVGTDANQLALLGGQVGNALLQDLTAVYEVGKSYRMTVGVCVSEMYPPSDPNGLKLSFYYTSPSDPNRVEIVAAVTGPPSSFTHKVLKNYSVYLPTVRVEDVWAGKTVGIALSATGPMGGYWDLDNVRVMEFSVPELTGDSFINLADFAKMAAQWLSCSETAADVTGEGCVDEQDLLILIEYWLSHV